MTSGGIHLRVRANTPADANAAAHRALHFGNLTYQGIKDILRKGLDLEPLSNAKKNKNGVLESPLFSRNFAEIVFPNLQES